MSPFPATWAAVLLALCTPAALPGGTAWLGPQDQPTSIVQTADDFRGTPEADFLGKAWTHPSGARITARLVQPTQPLQGNPAPPPSTFQYQVQILPSTGYVEVFILQVPLPLPRTPAPLLLGFHAFGQSHLDIFVNTGFPAEAATRGWFLLAPLGASKKHFSVIESQINTEAVLEWVLNGLGQRIDDSRIYGVGFSMGGGAVTNYAARHLDPQKPMIAALVDHSGGVALKNTYFHDAGARPILDLAFGNGTPGSADPWKLARSSVVNFDPVTLVVETDEDLARNLVSIPLKIQRAHTDSIRYVNDQCDVLDVQLRARGKVVGPEYAYEFIPPGPPSFGHSWAMLDFTAVCDWLSNHTLTLPSSAETLADQNARYYHFDVVQDAAGAFTPFSWSIDTGANELRLEQTANLLRMTVDLPATGLDPGQPLHLVLGTQDATPDEFRITGYPALPTTVLRDGVPDYIHWAYSASLSLLTVAEQDGQQHTWMFAP
jgi:pimeloyl-ACP methyl ester carboxylesterase